MTKTIGDSELIETWADNGTVSEPDNSKKDVGWNSGERPAYQFMNWFFNLVCEKLNAINKNGIPKYSANTTYNTGDVMVYTDHNVYKAVAGGTGLAPPNAMWALLVPEALQNNFEATAAPTVNNDTTEGYAPGSRWLDQTNDEAYICLDATAGAAVWDNTTLDSADLGSAAFENTSAFATAAQGALADTALQSGDVTQAILQRSSTIKTTAQSIASSRVIARDNTLPGITEGDAVMSVTHDRQAADSTLQIAIDLQFETPSNNPEVVVTLNDGTETIKTGSQHPHNSGRGTHFHAIYEVPADATGNITFEVRVGVASSSSGVYINTHDGSNVAFGGTLTSQITVTEYANSITA